MKTFRYGWLKSRREFLDKFIKAFGLVLASGLGWWPEWGRGEHQSGPDTLRASSPVSENVNPAVTTEPELYDCLILGGGLAGLSAANALARVPKSASGGAGSESSLSLLVIEGRGRLGGRIDTRYPQGFPGSVEMGAQYLHVDDDKNEKGQRLSLWRALEEYRISVTPLNRLRNGLVFSKYFSKLRKHWQVIFEFSPRFLLGFREEIASYRGPDLSQKQWLEFGPKGSSSSGKAPQSHYSKKEKPLVDLFLSGPASGRLEEMSLHGFNLDRFASMEAGQHEYKVNPGWSYFIEQLKFPLFPGRWRPRFGSALTVKYHSRVTEIRYDDAGVEVRVRETQQGRSGPVVAEAPAVEKVYRGRTAIVTFPIGVLRRAAGIDPRNSNDLLEFYPPLPSRKIRALRAIGVGVAAKLFVVFDARFWGDEVNLINRMDGLSRLGRTYFVPHVGEKEKNVVLGAYFGGDEAYKIQEKSVSEILDGVCAELAQIFPGAHQQRPIRERVKSNKEGQPLVIYKHWANDPWAYGNDSFLRFDKEDPQSEEFLAEARRELARATGPLFWAGEATVHEDGLDTLYARPHAGVTHGAHSSGLRAAHEVRRALQASFLARSEGKISL